MSNKMIKLKSSDGECFEVEEAVARQSETIAHLIEDDCADNEIPLANVNGKILSKVIAYCKKHVSEETEEDLKQFDAEFVKNIEQSTLFEIILAANYLNVKSLLDLTCQAVADMLTGKSPEDIRAEFHIKNDYTPEEYEQAKKDNQWAFE